MRNPWLHLPVTPPFVLPIDEPYVRAFNDALDERYAPTHALNTDLPPEPFAGPFDAPVLLLLANPGHKPGDFEQQRTPQAIERIYQNIQSDTGGPSWVFDDYFEDTEAGRWWRRRTADLADAVGGYGVLADRLLNVEFHGYHSPSWYPPFVTFPSQRFGFHLVRAAMERGSLIVVARAARYWYAAVPGLRHYDNMISNSNQAAHLSRGNLGVAFDRVVEALSA